ncbi:hypothetical protein OUZ56_026550 [Daphnia magna]|uniref:Uncharacterized protein n=1 Tax=Daphnia magna TaxID=35525 RepID=A0ABQ9ZM32_9CRUS|nr:hypothetical protein OUZ56_026550 [Daphnia magna]
MVSAGHRHSLRHRHHHRFKFIHGHNRKDEEYYCDYVLLGNRLVRQQAATSCGKSNRNASLATISEHDERRKKKGQDEKTAMLCCGRKKVAMYIMLWGG